VKRIPQIEHDVALVRLLRALEGQQVQLSMVQGERLLEALVAAFPYMLAGGPPVGTYRVWTANDRQLLQLLWSDTQVTLDDIGVALNRGAKSVQSQADRMGLGPRGTPMGRPRVVPPPPATSPTGTEVLQ
jgi:hypothetical protein